MDSIKTMDWPEFFIRSANNLDIGSIKNIFWDTAAYQFWKHWCCFGLYPVVQMCLNQGRCIFLKNSLKQGLGNIMNTIIQIMRKKQVKKIILEKKQFPYIRNMP